MLYPLLKLVHLLAVIVFLGNITTGLFWKAQADRTRDPRIIAHTLGSIIQSDQWFTIPGVVAILIGGFGAAIAGGIPLLRTGWILWSIVLFSVSGLAFMLKVAPLQRRMLGLAMDSPSQAFGWSRYRALSREWEVWGLVALLAPVGAAVLMVLKPRL